MTKKIVDKEDVAIDDECIDMQRPTVVKREEFVSTFKPDITDGMIPHDRGGDSGLSGHEDGQDDRGGQSLRNVECEETWKISPWRIGHPT